MIHHLSIAAREPQRVADALAEMMGGKAVKFPPNPGSFFALQLDDHGSGVEVYPAGTLLEPGGEVGAGFVKTGPRDGYRATHFALSVKTDAKKVEAIAKREGWHCYTCNPIPRHRGVDRERVDGRDSAARICRRIRRLHQSAKGADLDGERPGAARAAEGIVRDSVGVIFS